MDSLNFYQPQVLPTMAKMATEEELAEMEKLSAAYVPDQKVCTNALLLAGLG